LRPVEAIILAGGFGTRLRSAVPDVPKPMAQIAGKPFLELLLRSLAARGIEKVVLSVGFRAECITGHFAGHFAGLEIAYEIEDKPRGTGGAIAAALRHIRGYGVFVINGDTFVDFETNDLLTKWPGDKTPIVVARQVPDTARYGRIELRGDRILRFSRMENSGPGIIGAGCYLLPRDIFAHYRSQQDAFSFEDDFLATRAPLSLRAFVTAGYFIDIGVPADYQRAQIDLAHLAI
jgi:D-glycero-alpha-D-manno-heptose 1-phosphate guanylyltransferase